MTASVRSSWYWTGLFLGVSLLTPSLIIFCLAVSVGRISPGQALVDVCSRQFAARYNWYLITLFGAGPFVLLAGVRWAAAPSLAPKRLACVCVGGLLGILGFMVPAHVSVWYSQYAGDRLGATDVAALLLVPFYCGVTLLVGLLVGWAVSWLPYFRRN